jgi:Zn-dependent M28 family amino/carboxypeptidase
MYFRRLTLVALVALLSSGASSTLVAQQAAPQAARQAAIDVDAAQLMRDVEVLSADDMQGRLAGTASGAKAREYVLRRFKEIRLPPLAAASYEQPFTFEATRTSGEAGTPVRTREERRGTNLLGLIRGSARPQRYIIVTAHYDHIGVRNGVVFNGADDNASGVAALLAVAAHFLNHQPETSLVIAALDAEEAGLRGARAFLASGIVPKESIMLNVNIDMIGRDPDNVLYAVGTYHYPALKPFLEGIAQPPVQLRFGHDVPNTKEEDWTKDSDHTPFHEAHIPFVYFGVEDFENHHKATDDAATIQKDLMVGATRTIIAALQRFSRDMK